MTDVHFVWLRVLISGIPFMSTTVIKYLFWPIKKSPHGFRILTRYKTNVDFTRESRSDQAGISDGPHGRQAYQAISNDTRTLPSTAMSLASDDSAIGAETISRLLQYFSHVWSHSAIHTCWFSPYIYLGYYLGLQIERNCQSPATYIQYSASSYLLLCPFHILSC